MYELDIDDVDFRERIPLLQNEDFYKLCLDYSNGSKEEKELLKSKFADFELEEDEKITLKPEIDPREWKDTVNFNKMNVYRYMIVRAVIDLATKLDEEVEPLTAMNYMAGRIAPTPAMEIAIFTLIEKYHPRGEEVLNEWRAYCDKVYGKN